MDDDIASVSGSDLDAYDSRFEGLLTMLSGGRALHGDAASAARALLTSLKADLKEESRRMSTVRGEAVLTAAERAYYAPTIHQCSSEINVATNTTPDGRWYDDLYRSRVNLTHTLHQLRDGAD